MMWPGGQTVGIVTETPTAVSEFMEPITPTESVAWVRGCLFQVQEATSPRAQEDETGGTTVTHTQAECVMPVTQTGFVPAFDGSGNPIAPVDASTITADLALRFGGKDYQMRGDAVITYDFSAPEHVYCLAERQQG